MTRDREWSGSAIRVLAPRTRKGAEKTRHAVHDLLRNARIDASVEIVVEPTAESVFERSLDASLVLLPFDMQGKQLVDPFGSRPAPLLRRLPLVAMVRAAEDIDLEEDPEDSQTSRLVAALDRTRDAVERAQSIEKQAERALLDLERKQRALDDNAREEESGAQARREKEVTDAADTAHRLGRKARKAQETAAKAAVAVQELCADSPRALRDTADELAERTRDWYPERQGD